MKYFAYGSNMDAEQMGDRGAPFTDRRRAVLNGWVLKFNKRTTARDRVEDEGKGNVVPETGGVVEGALYEISEEGLCGLDRKEIGYHRIEKGVTEDDGKDVQAWVYIADSEMVHEGLKPTKRYLARYLKGRNILSPQYFEWLEGTETID